MTAPRTHSRRQVEMTVDSDGTMTVLVDGLRLLPATGVWRREDYPEVVDHATVNRSVAALVDVREAVRSAFRELVPAARVSPIPPRVVEVVGVGFLPGEQIAVAPLGLHVVACDDGSVPDRIELLPDGDEPTEVLLLGRTSGTLLVRPVQ